MLLKIFPFILHNDNKTVEVDCIRKYRHSPLSSYNLLPLRPNSPVQRPLVRKDTVNDDFTGNSSVMYRDPESKTEKVTDLHYSDDDFIELTYSECPIK